MKKLIMLPAALVFLISCNQSNKEKKDKEDTRIMLRADTLNVVKLTDTLVIYENACRGCAYEQSTRFDINDSLGVVKLFDIITTDNNPPDVDGGSVSKELILTPQKTGTTAFKLYKFLNQDVTATDSSRYTLYQLEVQN
ncbi:MAG: hypothetical protein WBC06_11945 [Chitinophagaceae bacterium]